MKNHSESASVVQNLKISDAEFRKASELVKSLAGIHLTDGKRELVSARLAKRLRALGLSTMNDYLDVVREDKTQAELVMMLDAISTNLTSFWRESDHFDYVVEKTAPAARSQRPAGNSHLVRRMFQRRRAVRFGDAAPRQTAQS
jgi:chemotaxis methyl-accepting protein methylase